MDKSFSVIDVLETSWDITRKNFLVIIGYSVVAFVVLAVVQLSSTYIMSIPNAFLNIVGLFAILIANSIATLGFYKLAFRLIDHDEEDFSALAIIPSWRNISSFMSLTLLLGLIVTTLTLIYTKLIEVDFFNEIVNIIKSNTTYLEILAVVAFLLLMLLTMRFMFFPCFIVDDDSSAFESLRQSRTLTQDNLLKIIAVLGIVIGFIALGFLALGVGIIVTYPFTNIILVVTYRKLVNNYTNEHQEEGIAQESNGD
ncbi:hypothetical protein [Pedobacter cryophilus]|uniref:DUF7847 domain-containing protein n=1 Tax=Pedobacter cryophilus TaxID=2571271 RepID=A0A4U1BZA9_9SPHI|nr:hypothetical protein [Pedobacter cryophilus]TKB96836.1 hypothetical protein FA046_12190 [Pedobacter cryophilus]